MRSNLFTALGIAFILCLCCSAAANAGDLGKFATASLAGCTDPAVTGFAILHERSSAEGVKVVDVGLTIIGLPDGKHGVHIHEVADCTPCGDAGGHFDPGPNGNSSPDGNHPFHLGDLINVDVKSGVGILATISTRVTISAGPLSVFDANGSAFIVHVSPDTYCPAGVVAGCAGGARAACGIINPL